jgi:hypothetical protein
MGDGLARLRRYHDHYYWYILSQHNIIIFKKVRMIDGHWWLSNAFSMKLVNKSRL